MQDQPTIWDMLAFENEETSMWSRRETEEYLKSLLRNTKFFEDDGSYEAPYLEGEKNFYDKADYFMDAYFYGDDDGVGRDYTTFAKLSEKDLIDHMEYFNQNEYQLGGEENFNKMLQYYQSLQEGFKALPSSEEFGLDRKIGDIETAGKRELKSAREGYIPGEILSRYGALQGKAGAQQKGEELEQAYTEDIYGVQRGMGRDVRSTYEDFEDEWFGGVESWLSNIG